MENKNTKFHPNPTIGNKVIGLNTITGRPGLPGLKCIGAAAATVAANGGLSTWGFKKALALTLTFHPRSRFCTRNTLKNVIAEKRK